MSDFRKLLALVEEMSDVEENIELHDSFELELNEDTVIETGVVGFMEDGIIIQGDDTIMEMLGEKMVLGSGSDARDSAVQFENGVDYEEYNDEAGMFKNNLQTLQRVSSHLEKVILDNENLPEWCQEKIAQAKGMVVSVMDYMISQHENGIVDTIDEAKYQGRTVQLNKPMQGDVAKSKVYVKGPKGNVVKVNFGDPNMRIKKSNPARRKSFRARHRCDNPGPKWKARYWSCRAW